MAAGPNINVDYGTIQAVAGQLTAAEINISPQVTDLYNSVHAMLSQTGGLWMKQSTPALQAEYDTFNTSAIAVVNAISSFADMFNKLASGLQNMDGQLAFNIQHPTSS